MIIPLELLSIPIQGFAQEAFTPPIRPEGVGAYKGPYPVTPSNRSPAPAGTVQKTEPYTFGTNPAIIIADAQAAIVKAGKNLLVYGAFILVAVILLYILVNGDTPKLR